MKKEIFNWKEFVKGFIISFFIFFILYFFILFLLYITILAPDGSLPWFILVAINIIISIPILLYLLLKKKKEFIYGLIAGLILAILIGSLVTEYLINQERPQMSRMEVVKNTGCNIYVNQNPPCSDWTKVNVTWQGKLMSYDEFIIEHFIGDKKTWYNCSGEDCARIICYCSVD